jgi:hypothetical protein
MGFVFSPEVGSTSPGVHPGFIFSAFVDCGLPLTMELPGCFCPLMAGKGYLTVRTTKAVQTVVDPNLRREDVLWAFKSQSGNATMSQYWISAENRRWMQARANCWASVCVP